MEESRVANNPELHQVASMCKISLPCDAKVDIASVEEKVKRVKAILESTDRSVLEGSLDTLEKIKALKNKFNVVD